MQFVDFIVALTSSIFFNNTDDNNAFFYVYYGKWWSSKSLNNIGIRYYVLSSYVLSKFDNIEHDSNMAVSTKRVSENICKLECGKSAGPDGIDDEYLKFSNYYYYYYIYL